MHRLLNAQLEASRDKLRVLCRKYDVSRLDLFGSAARDDWRPDGSDLDFIVTFRPDPGRSLADRFLGLAEELESLFGRPVDLLTERSIRNPYFRRGVDASRASVYAE
jgi:predicted nucleotidyltransferase